MNKWILEFMRNGGLMAEAVDGTESGGGGEALPDDLDFLLVSDEDGEPEPEPEPEPETEPSTDEEEIETTPEVEGLPTPEIVPEPESETLPEPEPEPEVIPEVKPEPETIVNPTEAEQAELKKNFLATVEKDFAISEEDANLIINEPETILPRLATQIYARAMDDAQGMINTAFKQIPQIIKNIQSQETQTESLNKQFHELNPGLDTLEATQLDELITAYAPLVNKQIPNGTAQEKMQTLGRMIAALKGIQIGTVTPAVVEELVPVHTPAAPARSGVNRGKPAPANESDAFIDMLLENPED